MSPHPEIIAAMREAWASPEWTLDVSIHDPFFSLPNTRLSVRLIAQHRASKQIVSGVVIITPDSTPGDLAVSMVTAARAYFERMPS